jgi:hypothetical protein
MRFLCDYLGRLGALLWPEKNEYEPKAAAARTFPPGVTESAGLNFWTRQRKRLGPQPRRSVNHVRLRRPLGPVGVHERLGHRPAMIDGLGRLRLHGLPLRLVVPRDGQRPIAVPECLCWLPPDFNFLASLFFDQACQVHRALICRG